MGRGWRKNVITLCEGEVSMDRKDIDQAAFNGKEIDSPIIADEIYWLGMYYIYKVCKTDNIPTE